jgi:phosphoglycerate dehydrogenase-like enzyme
VSDQRTRGQTGSLRGLDCLKVEFVFYRLMKGATTVAIDAGPQPTLAGRPHVLFAMKPELVPLIFPASVRDRLRKSADLAETPVAQDLTHASIRSDVERTQVLITGWGSPVLDAETLSHLPRLRAVLHAAGSVKPYITDACWERGLIISSAATANARPVAEYTLAMILMAGKGIFELRDEYRRERHFTLGRNVPYVGNFGRRVGIIGASRIGRQVMQLLKPFDLDVVVSDPYLAPEEARELGARLVDTDQLFATCDIVSVHAPALTETRCLVNHDRLSLMPDGAFLINTARGELVDTEALTRQLAAGRISAILDVTDPEPLPGNSPLFDLPNVFLTPHVAGSHGNELPRLGELVADELERLCSNVPLQHRVTTADIITAA